MIRLVLIILVIGVSGLAGITENKKTLFCDQTRRSQYESIPKLDSYINSVLCLGIIEIPDHEANPLTSIHKHFPSTNQFADKFKRGDFNIDEINLLYFIRKDYLFLSTLRI